MMIQSLLLRTPFVRVVIVLMISAIVLPGLADGDKLTELFSGLDQIELRLKGRVVLTANHTATDSVTEVEHHIFRDGPTWCVHTVRDYLGKEYEELTLRRDNEVIRFTLPYENSTIDDVGAMLFAPHINHDEISHFTPTQRCELVNLGILAGASIQNDLLQNNSNFGDTTIRYQDADPRLIEQIVIRMQGDNEFYGRAIDEIEMGGTAIYPKGGVKNMDVTVDQLSYEEFNGRPFLKKWTVTCRTTSDAGPVITEVSDFEVVHVGSGKSLERESELFGVNFAPGTPVDLNGSPLKYVWDGVWAVPMIHSLSPARFAQQKSGTWVYLMSGACLILLIGGVVWVVQGRKE